MTASTASTSPDAPAALPATPAPIDRTVPQELVDLAILAIKRGAVRVSLGLESLGSEFQAPIGWILWVSQGNKNGFPSSCATAMICHQIGCDFDDFVLPAWITGDDVTDQPVIDQLVELFEAGIKNGWSVKYERRVAEHLGFQKLALTYANSPLFSLRHELTGNASNWHYDQAAHDRGENVSTEVMFSASEDGDTGPIAFTTDGGTHRKVDPSHVDALLRAAAPDFVRVAYFDDDLEEWVK